MNPIRSRIGLAVLALTLSASGGCGGSRAIDADHSMDADLLASDGLEAVAEDPERPIAVGGTVYVPIYSHIALDDPDRTLPLAATLSIRNTDPERPILLDSIRYYGTDGSQIRGTKQGPYRLAPLASTEVVVRERDLSGGSGANFLVDWSAEEAVSPPLIQSVMIGSAGNMGISFVGEGVTLESSGSTEESTAATDP